MTRRNELPATNTTALPLPRRAQLALAELRHTIERRTRDAAARSATPFREAAEKLQRDLADEKVCDALSCYYY